MRELTSRYPDLAGKGNIEVAESNEARKTRLLITGSFGFFTGIVAGAAAVHAEKTGNPEDRYVSMLAGLMLNMMGEKPAPKILCYIIGLAIGYMLAQYFSQTAELDTTPPRLGM